MKTLLLLFLTSGLFGQPPVRWTIDSSKIQYLDSSMRWKVVDTGMCASFWDKAETLKMQSSLLEYISDDFIEDGQINQGYLIRAKSDSLQCVALKYQYIFIACKFGKDQTETTKTAMIGIISLYAKHKQRFQQYKNKAKPKSL